MQSKSTLYLCAMLFAALAFAMIPSDISDADPSYDVDYGQFYSYTLQFVFNGENAQSIEWDFGDGTPKSTEWNPEHTYAAKGTFYVTQTTKNTYNTESTTVQVYKVQIMGFPVISFESNGGSAVSSIQMDSYNTVATKPADPTKSGVSFAGWFTDSGLTTPYDWTQPVSMSFTLYAKWNAASAPTTYSVSFMTDGGSTVASQTIEANHKATQPANPTKNGFSFGGWFTDAACTQSFNFDTLVTHDYTLYAKWTANPAPQTSYTVTFDSDGGSAVSSQTVVSGQKATQPANPTRSGYAFVGWFVGETQFDFNSVITQNITLKAKWSVVPSPVGTKYTVTFDSMGGSSVAAQSIDSGLKATKPADPTKANCTFAGWFIDPTTGTAFSFDTPITSNITLKAKWTVNEPTPEEVHDVFEELKNSLTELFKEPLVLILIVIIALCVMVLIHYSRRRY